jgi:hypothetical protein
VLDGMVVQLNDDMTVGERGHVSAVTMRPDERSTVMLKNWIAAGVLGLMIGVSNAQAMPIGDIDRGDANLILVSGGCGPYWHRGPYGGCQPGGQWGYPGARWANGGIRPFYRPYCPPGYHLGPYRGACWPNV